MKEWLEFLVRFTGWDDSQYLDWFLSIGLGNRKFSIIIVVVIAMIVVDTAVLKSSVYITNQLIERSAIIIFALVSLPLAILQYVILRYVHSKTTRIKAEETRSLKVIHVGITLGQYAILAIIVTLIVQMISNSYYSTSLLEAAITVSYLLSITALSFLSLRFLFWFRSKKNILVLLYGISSAVLVINTALTLASAITILNTKNPEVVPHLGILQVIIEEGSFEDIVNRAYMISSILAFLAMWISTTLLLRYYSRTFGRTRYWIIISIPLVYFLTQFLSLFVDAFEPLLQMDRTAVSLVLTLAFALSKPAGGILFGIAFWIVSKKIPSKVIQDYMSISAYGLILFFAANQAVVLVSLTFYPPFGVAALSYMGLSSYFILIGIYYSAVSISQDRKVLTDMKKSAINESKLLESIGSAESQEKIIGQVMKVAKKNLANLIEESGVESSLGEEELKRYVNDVITDIKLKDTKSKERAQ